MSNNKNSRNLRRSIYGAIAVICCGAFFLAGRFYERRVKDSTVVSHAQTPTSSHGLVGGQRAQLITRRDNEKCEAISDLYGEVSQMNWDLFGPYKEFEAGKIDVAELRQQTAEPEIEILRRSTSMYKLANEIEDPELRNRAVAFASAVLQRQTGFAMIIEGLSLDDESKIVEGSKLFEEGRNKAIAANIELVGSENPNTTHLKRMLEAYEPNEN